jgi:hypothetical protein
MLLDQEQHINTCITAGAFMGTQKQTHAIWHARGFAGVLLESNGLTQHIRLCKTIRVHVHHSQHVLHGIAKSSLTAHSCTKAQMLGYAVKLGCSP